MAKLKSAKRKGDYNERLAVKELNRHLSGSSLVAVRTPGSGALSHRFDDCQDPHFAGDVQIRRESDQHILTTVEVKSRAKAITIADMNRWREFRPALMARQNRGEFLCSMWTTTWDELRTDDKPPRRHEGPTRGVRLADVYRMVEKSFPLLWDGVFYMDVAQLAVIYESAYGEWDETTV